MHTLAKKQGAVFSQLLAAKSYMDFSGSWSAVSVPKQVCKAAGLANMLYGQLRSHEHQLWPMPDFTACSIYLCSQH